jgi:hypothetical protein
MISKIIPCLLWLQIVVACLTAEEKETRTQTKNNIFGGLTFLRSRNIATGLENPIFAYEWSDVMLIPWEINDVSGMELALDLPGGFSLAPIHFLENDSTAKHSLILLSRKISTGRPRDKEYYQADWITYVTSSDATEPVMLILETVAGTDLYTATGFQAASSNLNVSVSELSYFLRINEPKTKVMVNIVDLERNPTELILHPDFIRGFDRVYWINGVFSNLFMNGSLSNARAHEHPLFQKSAGKTTSLLSKSHRTKHTFLKKSGKKTTKSSTTKSSHPKTHRSTNASLQNSLTEASRWSSFIKKHPHSIVTINTPIQVGEEVWVNSGTVNSNDN